MSTPNSRTSAGSATSGLGIANIDLPSKTSHSESSFSDYRPTYSTPSPRTVLRRPKSVNELANSFASRSSGRSTSHFGTGTGTYRQIDEMEPGRGQITSEPESSVQNRLPPTTASNPNTRRPELDRFRSDYPPLSRFSPPTPSGDISVPKISNPGMGRYNMTSALPWKTGGLMTPGGGSAAPSSRQHGLGAGIAVPGSGGNTPYIPVMEPFSTLTTGSEVFPSRIEGPRKRALSEGECQLTRQGTLLTPHANSKRASAELSVMLGSSSQRANKSKLLPQGELPIEEKLAKLDQVRLEAKKGRKARVEVDVILESEVFVEGGELRGRLEIRVRRGKKGETLWIGGGKVRVCGYEEHTHTSTRHIFYHYPHQLPLFAPYSDSSHPIFASEPNEEGYRMAREGVHVIPFSVRLPLRGGAKGAWSGSQHSGVRYVVVGSIKLHTPETKKRSIAHFYRPCVIFPYVEPSFAFSNTGNEAEFRTEQGLGWSLSGDKGQVAVSVKLPRPHWIAGQRVWLDITVGNRSSRKVKTMTLALLRTTTLYSPQAGGRKESANSPDLSKYTAHSSRKKLYEQTTEASAGPGSGYVGSTGWWTGVQPGERIRWQSSLQLPADCLSIPRSRLVDISYTIRLTLNGAVHLDVPVTVLNYMSIDPPPTCGFSAGVPQYYPVAVNNETDYVSYKMPQVLPQDFALNQVSGQEDLEERYQEESMDIFPETPTRIAMPEPKSLTSKPRPISMESGVAMHNGRVSFAPPLPMLPGQIGGFKSRPNSMYSLGRSQSTPQLRPGPSRRDTTLSYLSAVASEDEHDLQMLEARRRAGRQASLAAIMYRQTTDDEEILVEEASTVAASPGTFAPKTQPNSLEGSPEAAEIFEAHRDLDFVKATSTPEVGPADAFPPAVAASGSLYTRDSESRFLEEELQDEEGYESRFKEEMPQIPSPQIMSPAVQTSMSHRTPRSAMSHSIYETEEEAEEEEREASPDHTMGLSAESLAEHDKAQTDTTEQLDIAARQAHIGATRSMYGSFAASAVSVASGPESEVGQVVEAIRRNLTMRNPSSRLDTRGAGDRARPSVSDTLPNLRRYLDVPRSNSMGILSQAHEATSRRPSAPQVETRRPSNWSGLASTRQQAQPEPYGGTWLNSPYRRPSVPIMPRQLNESCTSPLREYALAAAIDPQYTNSLHASQGRNVFYDESPRTSRKNSEPLNGGRALAAPIPRRSVVSPLSFEPPEPTPGLAPSVASDSASSQSHDDGRATTPVNQRPRFSTRDSTGPMTPTYDRSRDEIEVRVWRESSSSAATSNPRHSLNTTKRLRVPSGPREKPNISPYKPSYPTMLEEEQILRAPQNLTVMTVNLEPPVSPTRKSHTTVLGSARLKSPFHESPVALSPHSARKMSDDDRMERLVSSSTRKQSVSQSLRASPRELERKASRSSIVSTSTTATQLETMILERKGSSYVFEHSKYMQGWTGQQKDVRVRGEEEASDGDETESVGLL